MYTFSFKIMKKEKDKNREKLGENISRIKRNSDAGVEKKILKDVHLLRMKICTKC